MCTGLPGQIVRLIGEKIRDAVAVQSTPGAPPAVAATEAANPSVAPASAFVHALSSATWELSSGPDDAIDGAVAAAGVEHDARRPELRSPLDDRPAVLLTSRHFWSNSKRVGTCVERKAHGVWVDSWPLRACVDVAPPESPPRPNPTPSQAAHGCVHSELSMLLA